MEDQELEKRIQTLQTELFAVLYGVGSKITQLQKPKVQIDGVLVWLVKLDKLQKAIDNLTEAL